MTTLHLQQGNNAIQDLTIDDLYEISNLCEEAQREVDKPYAIELSNISAHDLPAIDVAVFYADDGNMRYYIVDGLHRVYAAIARDEKTIKARLNNYNSVDDVIEHAFTANMKHGKRTNSQSRTSYARWLHKTYPEMGNNEIARRAGLDKAAVSRAISPSKDKETTIISEKQAAKKVIVTTHRAFMSIVEVLARIPHEDNDINDRLELIANATTDYLESIEDEKAKDDIRVDFSIMRDLLNAINV